MRLTHQAVDGVPEIRIVETPIYIPTDIIFNLSEPSDLLSANAMKSAINEVWHTGEATRNHAINTLMKSYSTPCVSQNQALRSLRAEFEADLVDFDAEILRLHKAISDLSLQLAETCKKRVQKKILANVCTTLLSPLQRFPPEILGEIFSYCVPSHGRPAVTEAPLSLSQVCSAWRAATFVCPRLWANLSLITPPSNKHDSDPNLGGITKLWFDRARNSPLALHFRNCYDSTYKFEDHSISTLNALTPYTNQFQKLRLESKSFHGIHKFLMLPPGHMNRLESLYLGITECCDAPLDSFSIFDGAPLLRELTLQSVMFDVGTSYSKLNLLWNHLTHITILGAAISQIELLKILGSSEQLILGSFSVSTGLDNSISFGDKRIRLERLMEFKLVLVMDEDLEDQLLIALNNLFFPALSKFRINGDPGRGMLCEIPLVSFLQNVGELRSLTLMALYARPQYFVPILECTPHLTKLKIDLDFDQGQYDEVIALFRYVEGQSGTYLPLLETLDINLLYEQLDFDLDEYEFITTIKSRQIRGISPPPVPFLAVHLRVPNISSSTEAPSHQFNILEKARGEGEIEIFIHYTDDGDDARASP